MSETYCSVRWTFADFGCPVHGASGHVCDYHAEPHAKHGCLCGCNMTRLAAETTGSFHYSNPFPSRSYDWTDLLTAVAVWDAACLSLAAQIVGLSYLWMWVLT